MATYSNKQDYKIFPDGNILNLVNGIVFNRQNVFEWKIYQDWLNGDTIYYKYRMNKYLIEFEEYNKWLAIQEYHNKYNQYLYEYSLYEKAKNDILSKTNYQDLLNTYYQNMENYYKLKETPNLDFLPIMPIKPILMIDYEKDYNLIEPKCPIKPEGYYTQEEVDANNKLIEMWELNRKEYISEFEGDVYSVPKPIKIYSSVELKNKYQFPPELPNKIKNTPTFVYTKEEYEYYSKILIDLEYQDMLHYGYYDSNNNHWKCNKNDIELLKDLIVYYQDKVIPIFVQDYNNNLLSITYEDLIELYESIYNHYLSIISIKYNNINDNSKDDTYFKLKNNSYHFLEHFR